jgi:hypothetical protein
MCSVLMLRSSWTGAHAALLHERVGHSIDHDAQLRGSVSLSGVCGRWCPEHSGALCCCVHRSCVLNFGQHAPPLEEDPVAGELCLTKCVNVELEDLKPEMPRTSPPRAGKVVKMAKGPPKIELSYSP